MTRAKQWHELSLSVRSDAVSWIEMFSAMLWLTGNSVAAEAVRAALAELQSAEALRQLAEPKETSK